MWWGHRVLTVTIDGMKAVNARKKNRVHHYTLAVFFLQTSHTHARTRLSQFNIIGIDQCSLSVIPIRSCFVFFFFHSSTIRYPTLAFINFITLQSVNSFPHWNCSLSLPQCNRNHIYWIIWCVVAACCPASKVHLFHFAQFTRTIRRDHDMINNVTNDSEGLISFDEL